MTQNLPVSRLVNVSIQLTPVAAALPNLSTLLVLGTSNVIDTVTRIRSYADLTEVAIDFSTTDEEYLAAQDWFAQSPTPDSIRIGRWANAATSGMLYCGQLSVDDQDFNTWEAIANGSFTIAFDGDPVTHVNGIDFTGVANMNAVAAKINTAMGADGGCTYDSVNKRFILTSDTTGATSSLSFLTAGNAGTDIAGMMAGLAADAPEAYLVPGLAAQTALATVQIFNDRFPGQWYGLQIPSANADDFADVAAYLEANDNTPHFQGFTSQDTGCIDPASTTDVMYLAKQAAYTRSAIQYSSTDQYAIASFLGRILTTNWNGSNTTITLMFKTEPGVTPENLSTTEADAIDSKNGNVYAAYNDGTSNIQTGITPSGQYVDTVIGCDWLRLAIQNACYNLLRSLPKIPQTDAGMHQLGTAIEGVCAQGVNNGLIAGGIWTGPAFGQLKTGDTLPKGYYVYVPPIANQSAADRQARISVPIQVAVKLAGAVQTVDVSIDVNP